jgi:predicted Zn-dependent protease
VKSSLILILLSTSAFAFELRKDRTGATVRWPQAVHFVVDARLDERLGAVGATAAVARALETWKAAGLDVSIEAGEVSGVSYSRTEPNRNEIVVIEKDWPYDRDVMAVTVVTVDAATHQIIDADIAINAVENRFSVLGAASTRGGQFVDVQNTLTHELGHALGLQHDSQHPESVMFPMAYAGDIDKRALSADDLAALDVLYPFGDDVGCSVSGGSPFMVLLALSAVRRSRKSAA